MLPKEGAGAGAGRRTPTDGKEEGPALGLARHAMMSHARRTRRPFPRQTVHLHRTRGAGDQDQDDRGDRPPLSHARGDGRHDRGGLLCRELRHRRCLRWPAPRGHLARGDREDARGSVLRTRSRLHLLHEVRAAHQQHDGGGHRPLLQADLDVAGPEGAGHVPGRQLRRRAGLRSHVPVLHPRGGGNRRAGRALRGRQAPLPVVGLGDRGPLRAGGPVQLHDQPGDAPHLQRLHPRGLVQDLRDAHLRVRLRLPRP